MRHPWIRVLDAALSGLLVGLLAAGPVFAQQPPLRLLPRALPAAAAPKLTVLVVPLDAAAHSQVPRLTYQAEQAVVGAGRFELVRLADALEAEAARTREAKAELAAVAFAEGQKAYDELDTQKALQQFDKATQGYEASDLSKHFADMSRARVMRLASHVANGDTQAAVKELPDVLGRNPRAEFSPNYFPADELALVEKTRKAVLAEADRTLEVKTAPVSAQVFVDGQFQGASPVKVSGLSRADHYVTVIAPGYALAQQRVSGTDASFTLQPLPVAKRLGELVERIQDEPQGEDRDQALKELGVLAGTQQVLALLVRGTPGAGAQDALALRLEVADGHSAGYATGPVPSSGEAMEAAIQTLLVNVLGADAPRVGGKPMSHHGAGGASSGRKTAGYVLMATGVALVAGGAFFGLQASSKADEFKDTPQRSPRADDLRSEGKRFALFADVGILSGLIAGGTGAWLAFGGGGSGTQAERVRPPPAPAPEPRPESAPTPPAATPPPEQTPAARPPEKPAAPPGKPSAKKRAEEERREREAARRAEEERRRQEEEAKRAEEERRQREEEERRRQEEEKRKRAEEEKRKREEEERRKREEERKKRPPLDEDDLRNY